MASSSNSPSQTSLGAALSDALTNQLLDSSNDPQQPSEARELPIDNSALDIQLLATLSENQPDSSDGPLSTTVQRAVERTVAALHATQRKVTENYNNRQKTRESGSQTTEIAPTLAVPSRDLTRRHIMISYNRDTCSSIAERIYRQLRAEGYRVWIDTEHLHGSVLSGMAAGLKSAYIVICLMNSQYYKSEYCKREATHAAEKRIDIIPCVMERNFELKGWLHTAIGDRLRVDFYAPNPFEAAFRRLILEIEHIEIQIGIRPVAQTAAACAGNIIHNYMASINRINQELESLTREEAIELIRRLRRELSTNANVSNEGDASQQPNQILQQLLAQPTNQRDLLRRAIELLPTLHTTAAIVNVFSIILFLWTTFQFLHKSFS